jgi:TonB family protein
MQPNDPLSPSSSVHSPPAPVSFADPPALEARAVPTTPSGARWQLHIATPALFVEARFRDLAIVGRLLRVDDRRGFSIGAARGATAPVNPAYLGGAAGLSEAPLHRLIEVEDDGFVLNLVGALSPELRTPTQRLALRPAPGLAAAPLTLGPESRLHVACGEVVFEICAAAPQPAVPRPWLSPDWRALGRYTLVTALVFLVLTIVLFSVPADPRALSLDELDVSRRFVGVQIIPPEMAAPEIDRALSWLKPAGGGAPAAAGPSGRSGQPDARKAAVAVAVDRRRATKGPAPQDAAEAAAQVRRNPLLAMLDGQRSASLVSVLSDRPALGADAQDALGHLVGNTIADAYGVGGLGIHGARPGGDGMGEATLGRGTIGTHGRFGDGDRAGSGPGYGNGVGQLATRRARVPEALPGIATVRGTLDKEIIRRIVRRHLNEVRFCYTQALAARPSLEGRLLVQFTIAPTGQVLASALGSSTLGAPAVESCVVQAVKRWEFPAPQGGGLAIVSYPFQLSAAGG